MPDSFNQRIHKARKPLRRYDWQIAIFITLAVICLIAMFLFVFIIGSITIFTLTEIAIASIVLLAFIKAYDTINNRGRYYPNDSVINYCPTLFKISRYFIPKSKSQILYYLMVNRLLNYDPDIEITNSHFTTASYTNLPILTIQAKSKSHHTKISFTAQLSQIKQLHKETHTETYKTINFKIEK